jgi:hypothetical protein
LAAVDDDLVEVGQAAKRWVGGDSCVWGLIWGFSERFTSPKLPSSADKHHRSPPFTRQDELQTGSELG